MITKPFWGVFHLKKRKMSNKVLSAAFLCLFTLGFDRVAIASGSQASDCANVLIEQKLPLTLKTRKSALRAQWEQVETVLIAARDAIEGKDCRLRFDQMFISKSDELLFPITHVVMKYVPEEALAGLNVYDSSGSLVGQYEGRVPHERTGGLYGQNRSVVLYSFQYKKDGEIHSLGRRLLKDDYFVRWSDVKTRIALSGRASVR